MTKIIKICLLALAFTSLVVDLNVFFPYTSSKSLFMQSFLALTSILFAGYFIYSKGFRQEINNKILKYLKHPLVLSILSFFFLFIVSAIFAVDTYDAFWGDISRTEGLTGVFFFFSFFVFSLLMFDKKDWIWFFKLSLFVTLALLFKEFTEFFGGNVRPSSFAGNPTFLSGYLLFSITSAFIVLSEQKNGYYKYFSIIILVLSFMGIFVTQTRGTILGLVLGTIAFFTYSAVRGREVILLKKLNLRKFSIIILCIFIIFSAIFISTRKSEIWQKVPGLSRIAQIDLKEDSTSASRLFIYNAGLKSVNPATNGWKKLLIGWGPDNFILANSKYYNVGHYEVDRSSFDRAHNRIVDVLVMHGLFGLLAYLSIWFFFLRSLLKNEYFSLTNAGLFLFSISFFVHLMFIFDVLVTSLPFFALLAFVVYLTANDKRELPQNKKIEILGGIVFVAVALSASFIFLKNTLPGYMTMRNYVSLIKSSDPTFIEKEVQNVFTPFTTAQMNIRKDFLRFTKDLSSRMEGETSDRLLALSITKAEEYVGKRSLDFRFLAVLADFYSHEGNSLKNGDYLKKGEVYFRKIFEYVPNRPDINRALAVNLYYQKKYDESFDYFEKAFDISPSYYLSSIEVIEGIYKNFIRYFYKTKNMENFIKTAERLKANNYSDSGNLDQIIQYIEKNNTWPKIEFK